MAKFKISNGPFTDSDLLMAPGGERIYHLDLKPEELAQDILIVGDPGRAEGIALDNFEALEKITRDLFDEIEVDRSGRISANVHTYKYPFEADVFHRGLRTITGKLKGTGQRVTAITSGMGTPSLEIVLNEIMILNEINLKTRMRDPQNPMYSDMNIIRVGTSGALQRDTELGTAIISDYVVGREATGQDYDVKLPKEYRRAALRLQKGVRSTLDGATRKGGRFSEDKSQAYAAKAHPEVVAALMQSAEEAGIRYQRGVTVSNAGLYNNQGRLVSGIPPKINEIEDVLASVDTGINVVTGGKKERLKLQNMEMEASILMHYTTGLNNRPGFKARYKAGAICAAIAHRPTDTFSATILQDVTDATKAALGALHKLRYAA